MYLIPLLVIAILALFFSMNREFFYRLLGYQFTLIVKSSPGKGGIVTPDGGRYGMNKRVTITAIPHNGWHFNRWEGDIDGINNPQEVIMDRHKTIIAIFVKPIDKDIPILPQKDMVPFRG